MCVSCCPLSVHNNVGYDSAAVGSMQIEFQVSLFFSFCVDGRRGLCVYAGAFDALVAWDLGGLVSCSGRGARGYADRKIFPLGVTPCFMLSK